MFLTNKAQLIFTAGVLAVSGLATSALANPSVGGAPMSPQLTVVQNASKAKNLTTLVAAVKAAGLVQTLSGPGPFTVFAPTNGAFAKLPKGTVEKLVQPAQRKTLVKILTYHVVPGKLTAAILMQRIKAGGGSTTLKTVEGEALTVRDQGGRLVVVDHKGGVAVIQTANVLQSNGVAHVIGSVLMP